MGGGSKRRERKKYLRRRDGSECFYCGIELDFDTPADGRCTPRHATIDEVIPRGRGGSERPENQRLVCYECNQGKGTASALDFVRSKERT